jgi:hypothetical protein
MWIAQPGCSAALALQMLLYRVRPKRARGFDSPEQVVTLVEFACWHSTPTRTRRDEGRNKLRRDRATCLVPIGDTDRSETLIGVGNVAPSSRPDLQDAGH